MYDERYDPDLHPDDASTSGSTVSRLVMISAVLSGGFLLYAVVSLIA
jgi:hypothetical protein